MIQGELDLELARFNSRLAEAVNNSARAGDAMRRNMSGVGDAAAAGAGGVGDAVAEQITGLLAVGGIAGVASAIKSITKSMGDLSDMSTRLNESPETLQRVGAAASWTDSSVEGLANSFLKLEKSLGTIDNEPAVEALERYGLTASQLAGMPLDQKILALAGAFQKARETGTGLADLQTLLGKSASELIPLLSMSTDEIKEMFESVSVVSEEVMERLAYLDDRMDQIGQSASTMAATVIDAFAGILEFSWDSLAHGGPTRAFERLGDKQMDAQLARAKRVRDREESRAKAAEGVGAAQSVAKEEEAKKKRETSEKKLDESKESVQSRQYEGMTDLDKLKALDEQLRSIFEKMQNSGGKFFASTVEGLEEWAKKLEKLGMKDEATKVYEMLRKALEVTQKMDGVSRGMREKAAQEAETKQKELEKLREDSEEKEGKLFSPEEQATQLREKLAQSLGLKITSAEDVSRGLEKARAEVEEKKKSGDVNGEFEARKRYNSALEQADQLSGLASGAKAPAALAGETAGALSLLMGGSGNDLVLDETKQQGQTLKDIQRVLERIQKGQEEGGYEGANSGFGFDFN